MIGAQGGSSSVLRASSPVIGYGKALPKTPHTPRPIYRTAASEPVAPRPRAMMSPGSSTLISTPHIKKPVLGPSASRSAPNPINRQMAVRPGVKPPISGSSPPHKHRSITQQVAVRSGVKPLSMVKVEQEPHMSSPSQSGPWKRELKRQHEANNSEGKFWDYKRGRFDSESPDIHR